MPNARGWYRKYVVARTDGKDGPGQKHDGCKLFVLDLTHDTFACYAAIEYARQCEKDYPNLATDLRVAANKTLNGPEDQIIRGTSL
jgi:hypothetical protein